MTPAEIKAEFLAGDFKLKAVFQQGDSNREVVLTRCEKYAGWTLPTIFPDESINEDDEMQNDYQSVGAQAVTNLANKIMMALFQPSRPFFRMQLTKEQRASTREGGLTDAQIDAALAAAERQAMNELVKWNARSVMTNIVMLLIITGNAMVRMPEKEGDNMQAYSIRDYMCVRDLQGKPFKMILCETKAMISLPGHLQKLCRDAGYTEDKDVSVYTGIHKLSDGRWVVWQELEDLAYAQKDIGLYTDNNLPYIPLTWNIVRNKDYGTGLVENYAGDFTTLSTLSEAILDYTTIVTDVKYLVNPAGMTDVRQLTESPSGSYVHGREEDLFVHTANVTNAADFLQHQFENVARRIGAAFLLNTAVTRDAERVTAEEIRMQAQELESSLGGVYSRLATELQAPLAKRLMSKLDNEFSDIEPIIVTGLESLSRNSELDRLRAFFQDLITLADVPEQVAMRIDYNDLIATLGSGHGVDYDKWLKDKKLVEREAKAKAQAQAQAAAMEAGAVQQATGQTK